MSQKWSLQYGGLHRKAVGREIPAEEKPYRCGAFKGAAGREHAIVGPKHDI